MAERDMTGAEWPEPDDVTAEPPEGAEADLAPGPVEPAPGLARRRAGGPSHPGRLGLDGLGAGLSGLAGGGGDLANLPPWSVRAQHDPGETARPQRDDIGHDPPEHDPAELDRAELDGPGGRGGGRPERDPVALAAWRRVAERRRRRAADLDVVPLTAPVEEPAAPPPEPEPSAAPVALGDAGPGAAPQPAGDSSGEPAADPGTETAEAGRGDDRGDPHPGPPASARPDPGGRHEVLLSLAGRIDDDALSLVRELVAVEDEAAAAELLGGCLLAAGSGVTPREHAVLARWFAASRVDPELVDALPRDPDADQRDVHRFSADPPLGSAEDAGEAVVRATARLPGVQRVRQCWRTTPAGSAPGPVPHRVVLVETHTPDACEHVAHHVAHAARELGAVSVEVFAAGTQLPAYHRAAARAARPLGAVPPGRVAPDAAVPSPAPSSPGAEPETGSVAPRAAEPVAGAAQVSTPVEGLAPGPAPVADLDPHVTAERIAALWRTPPPDEILSDEHPISSWTDPLGVTFGPTTEDPGPGADVPVRREAAHPSTGLDRGPEPVVDPDAATGDVPVPGGHARGGERPTDITPGPGAPAPDGAPAAGVDDARTRRARHSRGGDTGEFEVSAEATAGPGAPPWPSVGGMTGHAGPGGHAAPVPPAGGSGTDGVGPINGHQHGPGRPDGPDDAATEPVHRPEGAGPPPGGDGAASPAPREPEPAAPAAPTGSAAPTGTPAPADSVDSQLSDRERELLARLHEELASRERLEADAPDPLTGERPAERPDPATDPRPRPAGFPGRPGTVDGPANGPAHGQVNGHGLPPRRDHDDED